MANYPVTLRLYRLRLKQSFNISKAKAEEKDTLIVRYGSGLGEGSPSVHYGKSASEMKEVLDLRLREYGGNIDEDSLREFIEQLPREMNVARCGLEMAYLDNRARQKGIPLWQYLNLPKPRKAVSSFTITPGTEEEVQKQLERAEPFSAIKIKVGFARDLDFVDYILKHKDCRLRLDANGGWTVDQTIDALRQLRGYPVDFIEQPLTNPEIAELDKIKTKVACSIFLDESVVTVADVDKFAAVIDGVNVKLMRCGGITLAMEIAERARKHNLKLMLGCMIETAIGITAALHLESLFDYFDLDAILLTANDPYWGAQFVGETLLLPEGPGIGITTEENTLA